jgi:tRNA uridine 5-carboxymethylaminomethyl modification enzyme
MNSTYCFDSIVIGAGHAGIEATRALSAMGIRTALVTLDRNKIGAMSCNPAIGGVAKGHLVYEVDALGGLMGAAADLTGIQSRRLNLNKGPAVRSTRIQCDKDRYSRLMSQWVPALSNVTVIQGEGAQLIFSGDLKKVIGVVLKDGRKLSCQSVVITAGTFMRGLMFCGDDRSVGGRYGDSAADTLTLSILETGHTVKRLKTGTPARLKASSIYWDGLEKQWGDPEQRKFSWRNSHQKLPQLCCYLTYTTDITHEIIRKNFHQSPLFSGDITGIGPRYCPSVEDKVKRFPERLRHQIFLEPEGLDSDSIYPNGLSTSLPSHVQLEFLKSIPGLESVELLRPGYAVEYDTINPTDLASSFMSKFCDGLFFGGQVNRTSGYEEAAAQGLWAGINAALYCKGLDFVSPQRSRSYTETLVDDLTRNGTEEPYRMFTSRSEYRLLLREDNAHERLFDLASELGLLTDEQKFWHANLLTNVRSLETRVKGQQIRLTKDKIINYFNYLKRPEIHWEDLNLLGFEESDELDRAVEQVEIKAKYFGYLQKQEQEVRLLDLARTWRLDSTVDISKIPTLSMEVLEKYKSLQPKSVEELSKISGMTPTALVSIIKVAGRKVIESKSSYESLA